MRKKKYALMRLGMVVNSLIHSRLILRLPGTRNALYGVTQTVNLLLGGLDESGEAVVQSFAMLVGGMLLKSLCTDGAQEGLTTCLADNVLCSLVLTMKKKGGRGRLNG